MGSEQTALLRLIRAIAAGDDRAALAMLRETPILARSRFATYDVFFESITHYAYGGDTALHIAAAAYSVKMAEALLAAGADVSARNRRGAEPLHYAADGVPGSQAWNPAGQAKVIAMLIAAGADPDALDNGGVAPLHRAARTRCSAAVKALLDGGARPGKKTKSGSTAMDLAIKTTGRGGSGSAEAKAEQAEIIRLLHD